jgi:hexosaminidase
MRKFVTAILLLASVRAFAQQPDPSVIIPRPVSQSIGQGVFTVTRQTPIVAGTVDAQSVARIFNYFLDKKYGFTLKVVDKATPNAIVLKVVSSGDAEGKEGYRLDASTHSVNISGDRGGVFYGCQSLLQLMHPEGREFTVHAIVINDKPRFAYRGLMLDVGRHFFSVDEIKRVLDMMAYLKMNRFHWHLTDDQGWRLEIKKYPKLTAISAWRDSTIIGSYGDNKPFVYDHERTGGFYTQEQAREVVKYAAARNITVIPEIEMPGHSTAVLAAYPELGNDTTPYSVVGYWGVHKTIYKPGDQTFRFLEDVLTEVMDIFPSKYIHIGGDEVPKDEWKTSALAQQLIKENHLKNEDELQSWFIKRIEKFLNAHGRNLIGWDEILEGGISPNATIMSWRGEEGGIQAAKLNHDVIMTPGGYMYLDHAQSADKTMEPLSIGGFLPIKTVYNYNPVPAALSTDQQKYILGVQGNLWTEYIATDSKLEYMLFPRAIAVAEVGWTQPELKDLDNFKQSRLPVMLKDIEQMGMNFRIPEADTVVNTDPKTNEKQVTLIPLVAQSRIYYTIDGHKADNTGNLYKGPVTLPKMNAGQPAVLKYIVVTPGNRASAEYTLKINN